MRIVFLIVSAVVALAVGWFVLNSTASTTNTAAVQVPVPQPKQEVVVQEATVMIAAKDLPIGTQIVPELISTQKMPLHLVPDTFILQGTPAAENLVGSVVRSSFRMSEPLILAKISGANEAGYLASDLPEGMRAITFSIDSIRGAAGYVFPGDRVDILLTRDMQGASSVSGVDLSGRTTVSEVIAANVQVLAINNRDLANQNGSAVNTIPGSFTVLVTPKMAQDIRVAESSGTISVALRSSKDIENNNIVGASRDGVAVRVVRGVGRTADVVMMVPEVEDHQSVAPASASEQK